MLVSCEIVCGMAVVGVELSVPVDALEMCRFVVLTSYRFTPRISC